MIERSEVADWHGGLHSLDTSKRQIFICYSRAEPEQNILLEELFVAASQESDKAAAEDVETFLPRSG